MRKLLTILIVVLSTQFSATVSALEDCPTNVNVIWTDCVGTYNVANGDQYSGDFKDDKFHGQGTQTHANGNQYVGEFKENKMHGQGTLTYIDGDQYIGEWKDGKRHGQGISIWDQANGTETKFEGEWKDDKWYYGTLTIFGGDTYIGLWDPGNAFLEGVIIDAQGNKKTVNNREAHRKYQKQIANSRSNTKKSLADTIIEGAVDIMIYKSLGVKPTWNMKLVRADQFTCTYEDKDGDEITLPRKVKSSSAKLKKDPFFGGESIKTTTTFEKCD